jgi:tetratricopeptide (TPR) repeat protein
MARSKPPEPTGSPASADPASALEAPELDAPPEPLTPETALEWNRYYDRYVAGGVLLLAFLVSAHKLTGVSSSIWPMIRTGERIINRGSPITTDIYSYTESDKPWVNVPWLYEVGSHLLFSTSRTMFSADPATGDQIGAGVLVTLNALVRVLTVFLLLRLCRPGPGLWWFAVVSVLAMGYVVAPRYVSTTSGEQLEWLSVGGIARQAIVSPETWGTLLMAFAVLFLDRALVLGRKKALYALPPLFLLWANIDESFAFGLIALVVGCVSWLVSRPRQGNDGPSPALVGGIAAGCVAICALNPSLFRIYGEAFGPILSIPTVVFSSGNFLSMPDHLSFFGADSWDFLRRGSGDRAPVMRLAFYLVVVIVGLASFALNRRRMSRFGLALFIVAALLWGGLTRFSGEFAVIFTYILGRNGQEWFQSTYGVAGRISGGWTAWSVLGRALTILLVFLVMAKTLTGFGYTEGRPTFGFGFDPSEFDFEAGDYLKTAKFEGEVLNLSDTLGDAMIWRAYPRRKTFTDSRRGLFGGDVRRDLATFRSAFTEVRAGDGTADDSGPVTVKEDPDKWRPILDKYRATTVLMLWERDYRLYGAMLYSKNWTLLYDDGRSILFGRKDAPADELALFEKEKLDAREIVYHRRDRVPFPDRSPTAVTFIDRIIRNRSLSRRQPHINAADHWLTAGAVLAGGSLPDSAHCIMAIREARKAIRYNPDESDAYRYLEFAYEKLMENEVAAFRAKKQQVPVGYIAFRTRARITALNYAIQTTPPPVDRESQLILAESYKRLTLLHRGMGDLDLEHDALAAWRDLVPAGDVPAEELKRLDDLDNAIRRFKDDLQKAGNDSNLDAVARASIAENRGFPGLALQELEEAENQGVLIDKFLNMMVGLYCRTGQPEKANEKLQNRPLDDPALFFGGAGSPAYTHGLVNLLLGYYDNTVAFWRDKALVQALLSERSQKLAVAREILAGVPDRAVTTTLDLTGIPNRPGLIETEASWEFELALCLLESGNPDEAGKRFLRALEFNPRISVRPLIEDYLSKSKLNVPIPESLAIDAKPADPEAAKPDAPKEEKPAEPAKDTKPEAKPAEPAKDPKPEAKPEGPK